MSIKLKYKKKYYIDNNNKYKILTCKIIKNGEKLYEYFKKIN